jgi:hypothetical protein
MIPMDEHEKLREQLSQSHMQLDKTHQELGRLQRELTLLKDSSYIIASDKKPANLTATAVASIERKQVAKYKEELDRLKVELARAYRRVQELEYAQRQSSTALLGDSRGRRSSLGLDRLYVVLKDIKDQLSKKVTMNDADGDQESHRIMDPTIQDSLKSHLSKLENFLNSVAKSSESKSPDGHVPSENQFNNPDNRFFLLRNQVDDLENARQTLSDENRRSATKIVELLGENAHIQRQLFVAQTQLREMEHSYR